MINLNEQLQQTPQMNLEEDDSCRKFQLEENVSNKKQFFLL